MSNFKLVSDFKPAGDQPSAIKKIVAAIRNGQQHQTLLGVTGSGKTFTMANVVEQIQKPTLVLAPNKTLAAQLCSEFQDFFPENAVSYFVSYYDYYQPEAYIARTGTYIEKESSINEEIEKFRHAATYNLITRKDVLIVASVSCIYGLGDVEDYRTLSFSVKKGENIQREKLLRQLADLQYQRSNMDFKQGMIHVMGDTVEIFPPSLDTVWRLEFFGDEIERITEIDAFTGEEKKELTEIIIFPAKHNVSTQERIERAVSQIRIELAERLNQLKTMGKLVEADRLKTRTEYDVEMMLETGYTSGIENYTRHLSNRGPGETISTLLDYFPKDFLLFIDESHLSIPQIGGMFNGNLQRKTSLVEYGFRLPSSFDNRPLRFNEFEKFMHNVVYISATPSSYEMEHSKEQIVEQIIRPTGLVDPKIEVRPTKNQIDDLINEINKRIKAGQRTMVTTLTKRMSEELTDYLRDAGMKVRYLHSEIDTLERIEILRSLRLGEIDVLVGINLLREGLDLPEVSLICILDADKPGFLRSTSALIQTIGRCARNIDGLVIMYGDRITAAMDEAIKETNRRRDIQIKYNQDHNITPQTIKKAIRDITLLTKKKKKPTFDTKKVPLEEIERVVHSLEAQMKIASENLEFEKAGELRDQISKLRERKGGSIKKNLVN